MSRHNQNARVRISHEAARIMVEEGVRDFGVAKRKAAERLGATVNQHLPSNRDVEQSVVEYQRLFQAADHADYLLQLRREALAAMQFLDCFEPGLVGPVLSGSATRYSDINLHLFTDSTETVGVFLMDHDVPYELTSSRLRISANEYEEFPAYQFRAGETGVALTVFPVNGRRQAPLSPVDGKPMQRAWTKAVEALVNTESN